MASAPSYDLIYILTDEMLFPDGEPDDCLASAPDTLNYPGLPLTREEGQDRRVAWPYARIAGRSSIRRNC